MTDPNRLLSVQDAAQQMSPSQEPPDTVEVQPVDASPLTESLSPASADQTNNLVVGNPLAPSDVSSLPESPSSADNADQPEVFGQDDPDAFDRLPPVAPIESGDGMIGMLELQP